MQHLDTPSLMAGLAEIRLAPVDAGTLDLVVRRPGLGVREVLEEGELHPDWGLVGDTWSTRACKRTEDGSPHPGMQVSLVSSRFMALVAGTPDRWAPAGDQLYVDLDLRDANLGAGARLQIGSAVLEITDQPHNGCAKFRERFGADALTFVNSPPGKMLRLRGVYAKVTTAGTVRPGDTILKV